MAKVTPIQESFAAGEISPKLLGRRSIEGYRSGVQEMTNMIADARGPALGRSGFQFAQGFDANDMRLGLLTIGGNSNFLYVLTDFLMTITGILGAIPSENAVVNGDFNDQGAGWTTVNNGGGSSVNFDVGSVAINSGNGGNAYISQQLTLAGTGTNTVIVNTDGATTYRVRVGDTENSGEYLDITTSQTRIQVEGVIGTTTPWITVERISTDPGSDTITVFNVTLTDDVAQLTFVTPWPESELRDLYTVEAPDGKAVYMLHASYQTQKLELVAGVVTFGAVTFVGKPDAWIGDNWPASGTVFQGRLWLGGTPDTPQTFWGSKSGDIENFTLGENADDAMEFVISQFGAIVWMMGTKNLLLGTVNGEHVVSSEGGIITPTDVKIEQQSAYGSTNVQPIQVGDQVFYVSLEGTKVRALQYEWSADNWLSKDLTFFSEHITRSGIREMTWAPNPANLLICTLNNGDMAVLSYERGENVWGWHKHNTQGLVKDTTSGVSSGFSFIVSAIARQDIDPDVMYVEAIFGGTGVYMDSWTEQESGVAFTVVTGLEHLEGQLVQVVSDGAVAPSKVVSGGEITLDRPTFLVRVGLPYLSRIVSLPIESGAPTGSSLAYIKRYNRLIVGLLDSALPLINGVRAPDRHPSTPMNTVEPNKTGQVSAYQLGWSEGVVVTIEQDLPIALRVLYIGGELPQDVL